MATANQVRRISRIIAGTPMSSYFSESFVIMRSPSLREHFAISRSVAVAFIKSMSGLYEAIAIDVGIVAKQNGMFIWLRLFVHIADYDFSNVIQFRRAPIVVHWYAPSFRLWGLSAEFRHCSFAPRGLFKRRYSARSFEALSAVPSCHKFGLAKRCPFYNKPAGARWQPSP